VTGQPAVPAAVVGAWQLRLQMLEHRARRHSDQRETSYCPLCQERCRLHPPVGRLPLRIRGRDVLMAELSRSLARRKPQGGTWVLAGMGGLGKSTVALAVADRALKRGWRVWWITATDTASLTWGMLEVLAQLGAPESVTR
jgi:Mrp family chromosome partitioning ATPase